MKKIIYILSCSLVSLSISSQSVSFELEKALFEHPRPTDTGLNFPFIPFDYNNDGITDYTGSGFGDQYVYKGLNDGSFEQLELTWSQVPLKIVDWDSDGDMDAVFERHILITDPNDVFTVLNPSIHFSENITDVSDLNDDSFYDFVTIKRVTFEDNELAIYINNGDDTFVKTILADDEEFEIALFGDISLDGFPDIVYSGSSTYIGINNGDGTFTISEEKFSGSKDDILLTDLDGDEDLDLIILTGIVTMYKNENGIILKSSKKEIFDSAEIINAGDLNGDGANDLISLVYGDFDFRINLMTNDGTGNFDLFSENIISFPKPSIFGIPAPEIKRNNISLYDHDQDGKLDIVYVDGVTEPNSIMLLRNNTIINSASEVQKKGNLKLFPNPADRSIQIDIDNPTSYGFEIINLRGQIIRSGHLNSNQLELNGLPTGEYLITLNPKNSSDQSLSGKFIKI